MYGGYQGDVGDFHVLHFEFDEAPAAAVAAVKSGGGGEGKATEKTAGSAGAPSEEGEAEAEQQPSPPQIRARWERPEIDGECEGRAYHTLTVGPAERIFVFGGIHEGESSGSLQLVQLDNNEAPEWETPIADGLAPEPRFGHSCAWKLDSNRLIFVGGSNGADLLRDGEDLCGEVFVLVG